MRTLLVGAGDWGVVKALFKGRAFLLRETDDRQMKALFVSVKEFPWRVLAGMYYIQEH